MSKELFEYEDYDHHGEMCFSFTGITLKKDLGPFKAGEMFAFACIDYDKGILELRKDFDTEKVYEFSLTLKVKES